METLPSYAAGFLGVLLLTAFVKITTVLAIFRYGLGLTGPAFGVVILGVSLALSLLILEPQLKPYGGLGTVLHLSDSSESDLRDRFGSFLEKNSRPDIRARFGRLIEKVADNSSKKTGEGTVTTENQTDRHADREKEGGRHSFALLVSSFLVTELSEAFELGFLLLIPFLVIDLLVANILMALSITQISQQVVSLPLKILLFVAVDGWTLLSDKLISGYF